jgi:DNA modification methylase
MKTKTKQPLPGKTRKAPPRRGAPPKAPPPTEPEREPAAVVGRIGRPPANDASEEATDIRPPEFEVEAEGISKDGKPLVPGTQVEILPQLVAFLVPIERVRPDPANPRTVRDLGVVINSMGRFGCRWPLVVNSRTGVVEAGHQRLAALAALGASQVPVLWADDDGLTAQAFNIADNRVGELAATWDTGALERLLSGINVDASASPTPIDTAALFRDLGFPEGNLAALLNQTTGAEGTRTASKAKGKRVAPIPAAMLRAPVTRQGDRWVLGMHRLACGDCRDPKVVAWALAGLKCGIALTDPPYCSGSFQEAGKRAGTWGEIASDTLSSRGYASLMREWLTAAHPQIVYVFTDWRMWPALFDVVEASGLPVRSMIVWNKGHPGLGALWRTQHELIMYAARQGNKVDQLARTAAKGNVINAARSGNDLHYTQKPVDLLVEVLEGDAASGRTGPVFDPFGGCGSTLIACEALGRPCGTLEIEPRYADLICRRWAEQVGGTAAAVLEGTGQTWFEVAAARGVDVSDLEPAPPQRCDLAPEEMES